MPARLLGDRNAAVNRVSTEEVLNKAYRLAYFLHQDKDLALRIVAAATLKLNVAMAVQSKRLYYIPVGRFSRGESRRTDGIRNKALFSDLHLLQRLVYGESEPYERQKERAAMAGPPGVPADGCPASEDDLLVYFIKHLVRITTKRNAFYVTLGVSRLLHSYSTVETMELYNAVIGEPERVKDDYYYRSRKAVLMHEMYERFGQLIRACRQRRGEERFESQQGTSEQRSLVRECLRLFTPWDTQCPVPRDFDPLKSVIAALISKNSAEENRVEVNRIHAVLHPDCFARLVAAFGYGPPDERMELPRFFSNETNDQSPPGPRSAPSELSAEELAEINDMMTEQAGRRRRSATNAVIRVMVDGVERGRLNPAEQSSISFSTEEDAEIIEVTTTDPGGDLLLATYLLNSFAKEAHDTVVSSIRLEGGQQLSLSITRRSMEANGGPDILVRFSYQETDARRAARLWWQRLMLRFKPEQDPNARSLWGGGRIAARHILAGTIVVICLAGVLAYVGLRARRTVGPAGISSVQTTPVQDPSVPDRVNERPNQANAKPTEVSPTPTQPAQAARNQQATVDKTPRRESSTTPKSVAGSPATAAQVTNDVAADDVTRSGAAVPNLTLKEIKKVYIDILSEAAYDELRKNFVESFGSSGVVTATTNADEADASLKISVSQTRAGGIDATARLVNARGAVLWPKTGRGMRRYSGETSKVLSQIVNDLLSEIRLARAR